MMRNIKKCVDPYRNINTDIKPENDFKFIVKGQYETSIDPEDLELIRFMIGGIGAK
ncbi:hypothetical protein [Methanolobus halotolerans]|uniref:hypothetical protein n=1 Tax=Methanolobus halotolerans TaxID=2052935 RepID=UPI001436AA23|nr:hypothetical protein [Methanolobus halotolerans]